MIDEILRRWRIDGDIAAGLMFLRGRVQESPDFIEKIRIASFVGDAACKIFLGESDASQSRELRAWAATIEGWGPEAAVRAALAAGSLALPIWERRPESFAKAHLHAAPPKDQLRAVEEWLACPCDAHRDAARKTGRAEWDQARLIDMEGHAAFALAHDAIADVVEVLGKETAGIFLPDVLRSTAEAVGAAQRADANALCIPGDLDAGLQEVRAAIRGAIVPWALGLP